MTPRELLVSSWSTAHGLPMEIGDYHRHPAVSKSHLDQVARSPLHYWAAYVDPERKEREATPAMVIGSALHTHVLELDTWDQRYITAPDGLDRRTKAGKELWAAFEAEASSRQVLSRSDAELVISMGRAVWGHPAAAFLLNRPGLAEQTYLWLDEATGLECKCRPDWMTNDGQLIVDLKTTEDASPAGFRKSIAAWRYHVQAAHYLTGIEAATGRRPEQFIFICVEKKPPHAVAVYAASAEMVAAGAITAEADLARLALCREQNDWPGYSNQIEVIDLPPWMRPRPDGQPQLPAPHEIETY